MRKGQVTIFIIVGIVILITIAVLFLVVRANTQTAGPATVTVDVTEARTCLAQTTRAALGGLLDDGVLTEDEGGELPVLPEGDAYVYLERGAIMTGSLQAPIGAGAHYGLCDIEGPNAPVEVGGVTTNYCDPSVYHRAGGRDSIQKQLKETISPAMSRCIGDSFEAEVVIQDNSLLVRWPEPEIQHTEHLQLMTAYAAIEEIVRREVGEPGFDPETAELNCRSCADNIEVIRDSTQPKSADFPYDAYEIHVSGTHAVTILFEDRLPLLRHEGMIYTRSHDVTCSDAAGCTYAFLLADGDELRFRNPPPAFVEGPLAGDESNYEVTFNLCEAEVVDEEIYEIVLTDKYTRFTLTVEADKGACTE